MSYISKSGADFLEESNAVRYLKGDPKCQKSRATDWIQRNGIPKSVRGELSCFSVKTPFSVNEKFFLNLPDAMEIAEGTKNSIIYEYEWKTRRWVDLTEGQSKADMIADFMMYDSDDDCNWLIDTDDDHYTICQSDLETEEQWSSSWNWLMPVVRTICKNEKYIGDAYREHIADIICFAHIDDVHEAVISFLEHLARKEFD
tara:strand:+ start:244 stop:846 length:603 start_codon:yes stop_codon:yes gene_type:complete